MIYIGVTGGIGSGKSLVCSLFEKKNIPIFYADIVAKEIPEKNPAVLNEIIETFGQDVLNIHSRTLNKKKLADIVFAEHEQLLKLNAILHPRVFDEFEAWKRNLPKSRPYAIVEAALMFESGMDDRVDYVLAITADDLIRVKRVVNRDVSTEDQIRARMKHQLPSEELIEYADFVLHNNGTIEELGAKIDFFDLLFATLTTRKEEE